VDSVPPEALNGGSLISLQSLPSQTFIEMTVEVESNHWSPAEGVDGAVVATVNGTTPVRPEPSPVTLGVVIPVVPFNVILMSNPHDTSQREPDETVTLMPLLIEIGPTVWAFLVAGMV
jgi:hypothetical protein